MADLIASFDSLKVIVGGNEVPSSDIPLFVKIENHTRDEGDVPIYTNPIIRVMTPVLYDHHLRSHIKNGYSYQFRVDPSSPGTNINVRESDYDGINEEFIIEFYNQDVFTTIGSLDVVIRYDYTDPDTRYKITTEVANGVGTLTGGGYYKDGETATLGAQDSEYWAFEKWVGPNGQVVTNRSFSFVVSGDETWYAHFKEKPKCRIFVGTPTNFNWEWNEINCTLSTNRGTRSSYHYGVNRNLYMIGVVDPGQDATITVTPTDSSATQLVFYYADMNGNVINRLEGNTSITLNISQDIQVFALYGWDWFMSSPISIIPSSGAGTATGFQNVTTSPKNFFGKGIQIKAGEYYNLKATPSSGCEFELWNISNLFGGKGLRVESVDWSLAEQTIKIRGDYYYVSPYIHWPTGVSQSSYFTTNANFTPNDCYFTGYVPPPENCIIVTRIVTYDGHQTVEGDGDHDIEESEVYVNLDPGWFVCRFSIVDDSSKIKVKEELYDTPIYVNPFPIYYAQWQEGHTYTLYIWMCPVSTGEILCEPTSGKILCSYSNGHPMYL